MNDIMLTNDGDIVVGTDGDLSLTTSLIQAVEIRLRWIFQEWRLGPEFGLKWFEEIFVKNPNLEKIRVLIREEVMKVETVTGCVVKDLDYSPTDRTMSVLLSVQTDEETFTEEVTLYG